MTWRQRRAGLARGVAPKDSGGGGREKGGNTEAKREYSGTTAG